MTGQSTEPGNPIENPVAFRLAALGALIFISGQIAAAWVGFMQSDDLMYASTAAAWAGHGPTLADHHWGLRHAIVLPMALCFKIFGVNEFALELTPVFYTLLLIGVVCWCAWAAAGVWSGLFAALAMASVPMIVSSASVLCSDDAEAVFIVLSIASFHRGCERKHAGLLILAGVLAGLAAITRETTVCLAVFYAGLLAFGHGGDRRIYAWVVLGGVLVAGTDLVLLWAASGDPLYRIHTTLRGIAADNPGLPDRVPLLPRWAGTLVMVFASNAIGPLPWLAIPAAIAVARRPDRDRRTGLARLLLLFAAIWFAILTVVLRSLFLEPRYQTVAVATLAISLGIVLDRSMRAAHWRNPVLAMAFLTMSGMVLNALTDRNLIFSERKLVEIVRASPGRYRTDPATLLGARWLLAVDGLENHVEARPPEPGDTFVFSTRPRRPLPPDWPVRSPGSGWIELARFEEPPRSGIAVLNHLGLLPWLPEVAARKLMPPPRTTIVYRVPNTAGPAQPGG